jgi:hypothetical protein
LATAELFDPGTGTWTATGSMRFAREGAQAAVLNDGRVLVAGSGASFHSGFGEASFNAEVYDPETKRFSPAGEMPGEVRAVLTQPDGEVLLLTGLVDDAAGTLDPRWCRFDTRTDTCVDVAADEAPALRPDSLVVAMADGRILVAGGTGAPDPYGGFTFGVADAELFDPATGERSPLPDMPGPRAEATPVLLEDGSVLVIGGWRDGGDGNPIGIAKAFRFVPAR